MGSVTSETPSNATEEVRSCAFCRKDTDDQQPCTGCNYAPDYTGGKLSTTWFCCQHCKEAYEPSHTKVCKAADYRRTLYRAGQTTQLIFQCCQEALSKICITKVEKKGSSLYIYQANDIEKQTLPSLSSIFDTKDDKEAAMACMASGAAINLARGLLEHMIPELLLRFVRVDHTVKETPRRVITIQPDGTEIDNTSQPHSILQITLNNFESSAIDITGIQYGYHDPVVPWDIYRTSRIQHVSGVRALPSFADDQRRIDDGWFSESSEQHLFVASLLKAVMKWEAVNWPTQYILEGGWKREEWEYLEWRGELVEHVDRWVKDYAAKNEEAGIAGADNAKKEEAGIAGADNNQ